jgi:hypothetical protein
MSQVKYNAHDFFLSTRTGVKLGNAMDRAEERTGPEDVGEQALMRGLETDHQHECASHAALGPTWVHEARNSAVEGARIEMADFN